MLLVVLDMQKIRVRKNIFLYLEALLFYIKKIGKWSFLEVKISLWNR
jgi:hypothetical protein